MVYFLIKISQLSSTCLLSPLILTLFSLVPADFTFIYSNFIAPLPSEVDEFIFSLNMTFPHILDVNHLMKEIRPFQKSSSIPAALSYLKNHFFAPVDIEIPLEG